MEKRPGEKKSSAGNKNCLAKNSQNISSPPTAVCNEQRYLFVLPLFLLGAFVYLPGLPRDYSRPLATSIPHEQFNLQGTHKSKHTVTDSGHLPSSQSQQDLGFYLSIFFFSNAGLREKWPPRIWEYSPATAYMW